MSEPNQYEVLFNKIMTDDKRTTCCANMLIQNIDGIDVNCYMNVVQIRPPIEDVCLFTIECCWKKRLLYKHYCKNAIDLEELCTKILPTLKFNFALSEFWENGKEPQQSFAYDFVKLIPKNDNLVFVINECCVCLEPTTQMTSCKHNLCYKCESKINNKHCPMCRNRYNHVFFEDESESEDED